MSAYGFENDAQAEAFYADLLAVIAKHRPNIAAPEDMTDHLLDGFQPDAPGIISGMIIMFVEDQLDGSWVRTFRSYMPGTGMFAARGMAMDYSEWLA